LGSLNDLYFEIGTVVEFTPNYKDNFNKKKAVRKFPTAFFVQIVFL